MKIFSMGIQKNFLYFKATQYSKNDINIEYFLIEFLNDPYDCES